MSAQSLLDQRLKLNPEIFVDLNTEYLKGFYDEYRDIDVKTYKRYILKAIDGSDFEIPNTSKAKKEIKSMKNHDEIIELQHTKNRLNKRYFKDEMIYIMLEEDEEKRLKRYDKLSKKILKYKIPIKKYMQYKIQRRVENKNSYNKLKSF